MSARKERKNEMEDDSAGIWAVEDYQAALKGLDYHTDFASSKRGRMSLLAD